MSDEDAVVAAIQEILTPCEDLVAVYLFGSLAEGKAHALSDVDVAVLLAGQPDHDTLFRRTLAIGDMLERRLNSAVDVVALNRAPPLLAFQVIKTGRLVVERDRTQRCLFHVKAMNAYYDAKRYLDYQRTQTLHRIREEGLGRGYHGHRNALAEARRLRQALAPTPDSGSG